ncbi:LOB domain-containing protein 29-like [Cucurbita moschata]|uniref:LOB domain-containing protein 29-like n=1 Tax=Cucurbita moschata TaxID=3662 RepID=A0A6J1GR11_CUCMO|nr:LOB domain-containing protein 29-like [Cucurbita moschata]
MSPITHHNHPHHHHHHHHQLSKPAPSTASTLASATTQACAACKYQRRKCAPDCILAPYFPHDRQRQFLNAHKLFGVSNITKIIKNLDPFEKEEAMRTIIFQSDVRSMDPVGGCYRIIRDLQLQIEYIKTELDFVLSQLALCKQQAAAAAAVAILESDPMSGYGGLEHQFVEGYGGEGFVVGENENRETLEDQEVEVWGIQDSCSSLQLKPAGSVQDFHDIKIDTNNTNHHHRHHQQQQQQQQHLLRFQQDHHDHHDLVHHSEEALLKMDNVMLKESDPIQQAQDQELKGAVDTLFTFPTCDP